MLRRSGSQVVKLLVGIGALLFLLGALMSAAPAFADDGSESAEAVENLPRVGQKVKWADFTGAPTIPPNTVGLWVWSEDVSGQEILHVRVGSNGTAKKFTGTIRTNRAANFYDLAVVNGTGDDSATQTKYNAFTFSLNTTGGGEGVDVKWSGVWLFLNLKVDGAYVPSKIFTGAAAKPTTGAPLGVRAGRAGLLALPLTMLDGPTSFAKNVADGYYLYRDDKGHFHIRMTTTSENDVVDYHGFMLAEHAVFRAVHRFRLDPRDLLRFNDSKLEFNFHTHGYIDGVDWILTGKNKAHDMTFTLRMNGKMAAPNISLGSNPFGTVKAYTFRVVQ
ncbi:MAG TPA: hypothetical protein VFD70_26605 [Anaerolineae bacterium]|nr:hypothetical protein [Anaerolineae bacterium]